MSGLPFVNHAAKTTPHLKTNPLLFTAKQTTTVIGRRFLMAILATGAMVLTGCQTMQASSTNTNASTGMNASTDSYPNLLQSFNIRGKIGVTTPETQNTAAQSGSAFYVWAQEDDRFAIDLTGALGIGHTVIEYNGVEATLVNKEAGEILADDPEQLLLQATGWQAPISQLRYWISGRPAPSDSNSRLDEQGRIAASSNAGWDASFSYKNEHSIRPSKIKVVRTDGHRVIMTINHTQ